MRTVTYAARRFRDRADGGRVLADALAGYAGTPGLVVLGLPRGGVPVAAEVARALDAPLDVFLVRKLGAPGQPELAMGAVASGGVAVLNREVVEALGVGPDDLEDAVTRERAELERRERLYRGGRPPLDLAGKTVLLVDDGLATGSSMRAAVKAVRRLKPAVVVVAVPTGAPSTCEELGRLADGCVCAITPEPFQAVGLWYDDFRQTTDAEVCALLGRPAPPGGP